MSLLSIFFRDGELVDQFYILESSVKLILSNLRLFRENEDIMNCTFFVVRQLLGSPERIEKCHIQFPGIDTLVYLTLASDSVNHFVKM